MKIKQQLMDLYKEYINSNLSNSEFADKENVIESDLLILLEQGRIYTHQAYVEGLENDYSLSQNEPRN